VIVFTRAMQI